MLEEYKQMYEQSASFIENWKSKSKSELCRGYIENEHHPLLADAYFSAIVLKYWNMISRYYNRNTYIATLEDCYNWVIDSILYVLKTRKWADPTTKLGQDPNGADKAINRKIKCTWLTYCQSLNKDKRRINVDLLSLDGIQEGFDDVFVMENDDTDETSMLDLEYNFFRNTFEKKDYFASFLMWAICNSDCFTYYDDESVYHAIFDLKKLTGILKNISDEDCEEMSLMYEIPVEKIKFATKYHKELTHNKIRDKISKYLNYLKFSSQFHFVRRIN